MAEIGVPEGYAKEGEGSRMDTHLEEMVGPGPRTESWGGMRAQEGGGAGSEAMDATAGEASQQCHGKGHLRGGLKPLGLGRNGDKVGQRPGREGRGERVLGSGHHASLGTACAGEAGGAWGSMGIPHERAAWAPLWREEEPAAVRTGSRGGRRGDRGDSLLSPGAGLGPLEAGAPSLCLDGWAPGGSALSPGGCCLSLK